MVLLVAGPVLEDVDQVSDDILFLIDLAHVRDLGGRDSLQQQHLLVGNIRKFSALIKYYNLSFYLLGPALGYTLLMRCVAETLQVKLA